MNKSLFSGLFFALCLCNICNAQSQFKSIIKGSDSKYYNKRLVSLNSGSFVILQINDDSSSINIIKDIYLTKFNACDQVQWSKKITALEGASYLDGLDLIQTIDKGFLLVYGLGNTPTPPDSILVKNYPSMLISKLDSNGNIKWSKHTNNILLPNRDGWTPHLLSCIKVTDSSCILYGVASYIKQKGGMINDSLCSFAIKIDFRGNLIWSKRYSPSPQINTNWYNYYLEKILPLHDGGFLFYLNENILCKCDNKGNIIWQKNLNLGLDFMGPKNFGEDHFQNIYLSGSLGTFDAVMPFLLKIDSISNVFPPGPFPPEAPLFGHPLKTSFTIFDIFWLIQAP